MSEFDEAAVAKAYNQGLALEKAGDREGAARAYRRALALDPDDHGGVAIRLAAMGLGEMPDRMPDAYVATLFDQHADDFDDILVEQLRYCVPMQLREVLRTHGERRFAHVLDLGCGTGLAGLALRDVAGHLTGVDLSERIVELAVRGMLPKNKLGRKMLTRLKVYSGPEHPHSAQVIGSERAEMREADEQ